ncbi:ATP-binding protein [Paenibacillus yanchengensis]|uniref:ATP-binding protein n=1 Tax=Paenibacillus yanchengensis TaxID=2035833 RepID=A0ABW4YEP2_9BACL
MMRSEEDLLENSDVMQVRLHATIEQWSKLADELKRWGQRISLTAAMHDKVRLVAEEWFFNIVHHGCEQEGRTAGEELYVDVTATVADERQGEWQTLQLLFLDNGKPFDPLQHEAPNMHIPVATKPYGGLGIYLIRQLCSSCYYERKGTCNQLLMQLTNLDIQHMKDWSE